MAEHVNRPRREVRANRTVTQMDGTKCHVLYSRRIETKFLQFFLRLNTATV